MNISTSSSVIDRVSSVVFMFLLSIFYQHLIFLYDHPSNLVDAKELLKKCPVHDASGNVTKVYKIARKPCTPNFAYCLPNKPPRPAACPGKLVYNPRREKCDTKLACREGNSDETIEDNECLTKSCGLYGSVDCKKYYICAGGTKVWKKCPGETTFDHERGECKLNAKCRYPAKPIVPTHLPDENITNLLYDSEQATCEYHDFDGPDEFTEDAGAKPTGIILDSLKVTDWGTWLPWKNCSQDQYIVGMAVWKRSTESKDEKFDHAGVISLGFRCQNLLSKKKNVTTIGQCANGSPDSVWDFFLKCEKGAAVGFQLAQLEDQGKSGDDVATDNIKMFCSCGVNKAMFKPYHLPEPKYKKVGGQRGQWTEKRFCKEKQALCGFTTQMEDWEYIKDVNIEVSDMTAMNQAKFKCCDVPSPALTCEPKAVRKYLQTCNNLQGFVKRPCPFETIVGTLYNAFNMSKAAQFYTSIGYSMQESLPHLETRMRQQLPPCVGGKKKLCKHEWIRKEKVDVKRMFQPAIKERSEVNITAGVEMRVMQIVVQCGIYETYTNQVFLEPKSARQGNKSLPEPESHLFEATFTHYARKKRSPQLRSVAINPSTSQDPPYIF